MKKVTPVLSALAVAATVSTVMAHTKAAVLQFYCVAYEQILDDNGQVIETITAPYDFFQWGNSHPGPCTRIVAVNIQSVGFPLSMYGVVKTTPPSIPCQFPILSCPAIRATPEI